MEENNTDALLEELKHLNDDLKTAAENVNDTPTEVSESQPSAVVCTTTPSPTAVSTINNTNLSDFILKKSEEIVNNGLLTINALKNDISMTFDAKAMTGFADIVKATTTALETLNKIYIEQEKIKSAKELKNMDIDAKKELVQHKKAPVTNNLTIVAGREEIMRMLSTSDAEQLPVIDVESTQINQ